MSFNEWKEYKFQEITINHNNKRVPLSSKQRKLKQGVFNYYGAQGVIDYIDEYIFEGEYLLIAEDGANLETRNEDIARLTKKNEKFWVNNHAHIIKSNDKADIRYLMYFLNYSDISAYVTGSAQPKLNKANLNSIKIFLPDKKEQKAIADILSDLDEKIEINNKISENLEKTAQAIFKQWFVDFEFPNENGEPYKSSGGEMIESELGEIPKGWEVNKLSELANMKNGVNYGRDQEGEEIKVVNVRDFDGSLLVDYEKLDSIFLSKKQIEDYKLEKYDTVIVRSAKPGETLLVNDSKLKVYSGFTIRIRVKNYDKKLYTFYCVRNSIKQLENSSNGTIFKNLNQQLLGALNIIEPCKKVLEKYNRIICSIIEKIYSINEENTKLIKLRDTLLPKLMSGEIRVPLD